MQENGRLQQAVAEKDQQAEELLQTIREGEAQRRALHIAVQELKGVPPPSAHPPLQAELPGAAKR